VLGPGAVGAFGDTARALNCTMFELPAATGLASTALTRNMDAPGTQAYRQFGNAVAPPALADP